MRTADIVSCRIARVRHRNDGLSILLALDILLLDSPVIDSPPDRRRIPLRPQDSIPRPSGDPASRPVYRLGSLPLSRLDLELPPRSSSDRSLSLDPDPGS